MFKGNLPLAACLWLTSVAAYSQSSYIFQLPGANATGTQIVGLGDDSFSRSIGNASGPAGAFQVLATPNGGTFFIVSSSGLQSASPTLTSLTSISGVTGTINSALITPDGKYLLVVADHFYIIDTSSNTIVRTDVGLPANASPVAVAVSKDSQTAWVLSTDNNTGGALESVNLSNFQTSQPTALSNIDRTRSLTLSPLGLLYVTTTGDLLYEIDPGTLAKTATGNIQVPSGLYGPLRFSPDGASAFAVNQNVCPACASLIMFNSAAHNVIGWPAAPDGTQPTFTDVFPGGSGHTFAFAPRTLNPSASTPNLWDVSTSPFSATASALGGFPGPGLPIYNVISVAMSNEKPAARFLYLLTQDTTRPFVRVSLSDSTVAVTSVSQQNGVLSFTPIPTTSGASNIVTLNRTPSVSAGATSTPLIGYVTDSVGRPVFNVPVCFTGDPGVSVNSPSQNTNADGAVQTTITAPNVNGNYSVVLSVGTACPNPGNLLSATYTINVGGSTQGSSQISIYTGDGQLLRQNNSTTVTQPLTVKVTDTTGAPIAGAQVTFAVSQGVGLISPVDSVTDDNGLFRANFITGLVDQSHAFQATTVTASSAYGSVDFVETTHNASAIDAGQPGVQILTPANQQLTIPQGTVIPNAITAKTTSGHFPQAGTVIPNIGIRLADPDISDLSKIASCQGSTRGGDDGISHCNVLAACQPAGTLPQTFQVVAAVGEYAFYPMLVTVTPGSPSLLSIVSGNNQTGTPGTAFTLIAKVTDGCNQNSSGVNVNWNVTQGSASLSQVQTVTSTNGSVSAKVTLGQTAGPVQVTVSAAGIAPIVFNLTTQIPVGGISLVSGGGQSANINSAFAAPVVFVVRDTNGNPVPGLLINFSVTGSATISANSATTNAQGQVQVNVTAGATPDTIHVTAAYNNLFATAVLSSHLPGPDISNNSFRNAASLAVGLTPCGLITVTGNGLAPNVQGTVSGVSLFGPLPYTLAGVSITVNNIPAPIQAVANSNGVQQVNFQAPCELAAGNVTVVVTVNGASATVYGVPVFAVQPGIFTYPGPNNKPYGSVIRASDGTYLTPSNPARRGDRLYMVVTGLGQVTPTATTNSAGTGAQNVNLPIAVGINDRAVPVLSARYLAGYIGAYLVEFTVPNDATLGNDQDLLIAALVNGTTYVFGNVAFVPGVVAGP